MADLVSDLKLLRDLGLHCLHPFLRISLTEMVDNNELFFSGTQIFYLVNKAHHITESQGSRYSHQPAQLSFMGKQILSYRQNKNINNDFDGNFDILLFFTCKAAKHLKTQLADRIYVSLSADKHQIVGRLKLLH